MIETINNINDVKTFFVQLLNESLNFHPDEDFKNYINGDTKEPTYTIEEAEIRNMLLDKCFIECENVDVDIYELSMEIFPPFHWKF